MAGQVTREPRSGRMALLLALALPIAAVPIVTGTAKTSQQSTTSQNAVSNETLADASTEPAFEVASIRPANRGDGRHWFGIRTDAAGRFEASAMPLSSLVGTAYISGPGNGQVSGGPNWGASDSFDVNAKVDDAYMAGWDKLSREERMNRVRPMIRRLLADRFHLKLKIETKPTPVYVLVQARGGTKMKEVPAPAPVDGDPTEAVMRQMRDNPGKPIPGNIMCSGNACTGVAVPMTSAIGQIAGSSHADRIVLNQTGLNGYYSFTFPQLPGSDESAMTQVEEALGLKFEPRTIPMKTYVIVSADKPSLDGAE